MTSVNPITAVKPGATVLLNGVDERGRTEVVLVSQRYGKGKSLAFTVQDSWLWQMHASIPLEDQTHENFWRQELRWLIDGVPGVVEARGTQDRVEPGEAVTLEATIVDKTYVELNDANVTARVTRPNGSTLDVPLEWTGERDGLYRGRFVSAGAGTYEVAVDSSRGSAIVGSGKAYVRAGASDAEFFDPTMHEAPMRRIADETGGRFYTPDTTAGLAEDVRYAGRGVTSVEERELWNMPVILIALMGLVCAEWGYRRAVGLA